MNKEKGVRGMRFGQYIREKRLEDKMGLRTFAEKIGEDPGNWCRIEHGSFSPPSDIKILNKICGILNIVGDGKTKLFDLVAKETKEKVPADIKKQIEENEIVPILFRTIDKKKLSKEQLKKLVKRIKDEY